MSEIRDLANVVYGRGRTGSLYMLLLEERRWRGKRRGSSSASRELMVKVYRRWYSPSWSRRSHSLRVLASGRKRRRWCPPGGSSGSGSAANSGRASDHKSERPTVPAWPAWSGPSSGHKLERPSGRPLGPPDRPPSTSTSTRIWSRQVENSPRSAWMWAHRAGGVCPKSRSRGRGHTLGRTSGHTLGRTSG